MCCIKYVSLLLLLLLFGCEKSEKTHEIKRNYPDNKYHDTDLRISSGKNLLADGSPLASYEEAEGLFLRSLHDMAIDPETKDLFLIEKENDSIIKLDSSGAPLLKIHEIGRGPGEFTWPYSMKVRNRRLYISDTKQNKVSIYSLEGTFIKDVIPKGITFQDFEVTPSGDIIITNLYLPRYGGALFLIFDENGNKIDQFGENHIVQQDYKESGRISSVNLTLSKKGQLVLIFDIPGIFYVYDLPQKELSHSFSIQGGQEWEASVEGEKNMRGYPVRIRDVCITSEGDMLVGWGGPFKDDISIGMRFSSDGEFLGRIFSNEQLGYAPSHMVLENDSTLWVQNLTTYQLFRTHLRPAHEKTVRRDSEGNNQ